MNEHSEPVKELLGNNASPDFYSSLVTEHMVNVDAVKVEAERLAELEAKKVIIDALLKRVHKDGVTDIEDAGEHGKNMQLLKEEMVRACIM